VHQFVNLSSSGSEPGEEEQGGSSDIKLGREVNKKEKNELETSKKENEGERRNERKEQPSHFLFTGTVRVLET
jgi:hypothetical protein